MESTTKEYSQDYFNALFDTYDENDWGDYFPKKRKTLVKKLTKFISDQLDSEELQNRAKTLDLKLQRGKEYFLKDHQPNPCKENPFMWLGGCTSEISYQIHKKYPNDYACSQIFADHTSFACGIFDNWTTQEESTLRDVNPELISWIIANKFVKYEEEDEHIRFRYVHTQTKKGEDPLSTSDGYLINAQFCLHDLQILKEPYRATLLFTSFPSLTDDKYSFDVMGNVLWGMKYREAVGDKITAEQLETMIRLLYHNKKKNRLIYDLSSEEFRKAMIMVLFSTDITYNEKHKETILNQIITAAHLSDQDDQDEEGKGNKKKVAADSGFEDEDELKTLRKKAEIDKESANELYKSAKQNYLLTVTRVVRSWICMARDKGVKYFIGGPIGCGAFFNNPVIVCKIIASEFVKYGGGMKFVYGAYNGEEDEKLPYFENAFEQAFKELNKKGK